MDNRKIATGKVAASSILEVVVSMVIIILVLGISLMIYSNVMRLSLSVKRLKAQFALQQAMVCIQSGSGSEQLQNDAATDDIQIEQVLKPYESGGDLILVNLTAFDRNHEKVAELNRIIISSKHGE